MSTSGSVRRVDSLDGLRAIAIVLVVLFHLGLPVFASGFVGVDMFFVLSGFLVTALLVKEHGASGGIAKTDFWARRARRLVPAVGLLLLVVAAIGPLIYTYSQVTTLREDLLWSTVYLVNWHFIQTSSYFEFTGFVSPLQHLWALAVEVQFYAVWLFTVAGVLAVSRRRLLPLAMVASVLTLVSLALFVTRYDPIAVDRVYMGTDTRLFQPLLGALAAVLLASAGQRQISPRLGIGACVTGIALLVVSLTVIDPAGATYFRGGAALVTFATLLMVLPLWLDKAGVIGRALSWRPMVALGAISYGLYLWHWPIILWLRANDETASSRPLRQIAAVVLSVLAATVSYLLIERPVLRSSLGRHGGASARRRAARWTVAAGISALLLVASVSAVATRVPAPEPDQPVILLVGDSVPERLAAAFDVAGEERGWRVYSAAIGGCPVSGDRLVPKFRHHQADPDYCERETRNAQDSMIELYDPDVVVWWDRYSLGSFETTAGETVPAGSRRFWDLKRDIVDETVQRLRRDGAAIAFVATEPYGVGSRDYTECEDCGTAWSRFVSTHYETVTTHWNELLESFVSEHPDRAVFIDITDEVCAVAETRCDDRIDGVLARPDGIHYAGSGEHLVTDLILSAIAPLVTPVDGSRAT